MNNQTDHIQYLFSKYFSGKATHEEAEEFLKLLSQGSFDHEMIRSMMESMNSTSPANNLDLKRWEAVLTKIQKRISTVPLKHKLWRKISIAASVTVLLSCLGLYYFTNINKANQIADISKTEITPGQNAATLTLANGKKIKLTNALKGKVAQESGVIISNTASGELVYQPLANASGKDADRLNSLSTANGETYHLRLPDNTDVLLNAGSSLSYNTALLENGKRTVRLTGEAYFEVAKDKKHPFVVVSDKQQIEVLGTHFNVNSYDDESAIKTTLLEGSVQITSSEGKVIKMKPGQQVSLVGSTFSIADVDPDDAIAWTKGQLQFDNKSVPEIMRQIAKWYNVEIIFDSEVPEGEWSGSISRNRPLQQVLRMLEKSNGIRFRVEGKKIYVRK